MRRRAFQIERFESRRMRAGDPVSAWTDPSISYSLVRDGSQVLGESSSLYAKLDTVAPRDVWQSMFDRALQEWAQSSPLDFHRVKDDGSSVLIPGAGQGDPRFGDIRVSAKSLDGAVMAYRPDTSSTLAGDIILNTNATFTLGGTNDLYAVFLRGIGESLGVNYSLIPDPGFGFRQILTAGEIGTIQTLYGRRRDDYVDRYESNNSFATATRLTADPAGAVNVRADISTPSDVDMYEITVPDAKVEKMEITMTSQGISLLAPMLFIYNSTGALIGWADTNEVQIIAQGTTGSGLSSPSATSSQVPNNSNGTPSQMPLDRNYGSAIQLAFQGVAAGEKYYVMALAGALDEFGTGGYQLRTAFTGDVPAQTNDDASGVLKKTPFSYLTREAVDYVGLNYTTGNWTAEFAVDLDADAYLGDYGEFFRHGMQANGFSSQRAGWFIGTTSGGYRVGGPVGLATVLSDGNGQAITLYADLPKGGGHVALTFDAELKKLSLYLNGQLVSSQSNLALSLPADFGGELTIGAGNKVYAEYSPRVNGAAMPEFDMHFARIWNDDLDADQVLNIYRRWRNGGITAAPRELNAQPVVEYLMNGEVGDRAGAPGTGWIKDNAGGNHLKIVNTNVLAGPQSSIRIASGVLRAVSPANGATNVSGAVHLRANGVVDDGEAMRYFFEIDTLATFNGPNLRRSGWTSVEGDWQPLLSPNTTYYWRVAARDMSVSPAKTEWSQVYTFSTRGPEDWYVRPKSAPGSYGTEDGSTYSNAWNDLRWNGPQGGIQLRELISQVDFDKVAPGDTVYVTGDWGLMQSADWSVGGNNPQKRGIFAVGKSAAEPIHIRLDYESSPARFYSFYRYTGTETWVNEGNGVFSTGQFATTQWLAADKNGRPDININDPNSDTLLYLDGGKTLANPGFYYQGGRMYVRMRDGLSPASRLWYLIEGDAGFDLRLPDSHFLQITGGEFYGTSPIANITGYETTDFVLKGAKIKYSPNLSAIAISDFNDRWTLDGVEISYARNGVYGNNTGDPSTRRTGDNITIRNSHIHHIGIGPWDDDDSHAIGVQSGNGWVVEDNLIQHTGSAIDFWTDVEKEQRDAKIRRNVIMDARVRRVTYGAGIAVTNSTYRLGNRTGFEITDNVIMETDGSGMQINLGDPVTITGNLIMHVGYGTQDYTQHGIAVGTGTRSQVTLESNVIYDAQRRFLQISGAAGPSGNSIDHNLYWNDTPLTGDRFFATNVALGSWAVWVAAGIHDQHSAFGDPALAPLPSGFSAVNIDFFMAQVMGDFTGDGRVDQLDKVALLATPGGNKPALVRLMDQLIAVGN